MSGRKPAPPLLRLAIEAGPLIVFFLANQFADLFVATAAFMIATAVALALGWLLERRVAMMPLISGAFILVFGGLTLLIEDALFIKIKPTIVNLLFAAALLGGLAFGRPLLKVAMGDALALTDRGWRLLSLRFGLFFIFLALVNEIVWRNFSEDFWVGFKLFGVLPMTMLFMLAQTPMMTREQLREDGADGPPP